VRSNSDPSRLILSVFQKMSVQLLLESEKSKSVKSHQMAAAFFRGKTVVKPRFQSTKAFTNIKDAFGQFIFQNQ
jgi:hypothetical protein